MIKNVPENLKYLPELAMKIWFEGEEHILPEKITADEYELAQLFMTREEKDIWEESYTLSEDSSYYDRAAYSEKELDELDEKLLTPVVLTYRMANMSEADFKDLISEVLAKNPQTAAAAEHLDEMSVGISVSCCRWICMFLRRRMRMSPFKIAGALRKF